MTTDNYNDAFEYVVGTLRGDERQHFVQQVSDNRALQQEVGFWEEHLLTLNQSVEEITPLPSTWEAIEQRLRRLIQAAAPTSSGSLLGPWLWRVGLTVSVLSLALIGLLWLKPSDGINADYVAVLTDEMGNARLTAITEQGGSILWLQWDEDLELEADGSLQLWAVSRRDGQSRSLAVFEGGKPVTLPLNETNLRLIRDASDLILTREESGGSAIDEPSDSVFAQGECVRLRDPSNPS